jgi:hypothetical protein
MITPDRDHPARALPSSGPLMYEIIEMPMMRPRMAFGTA